MHADITNDNAMRQAPMTVSTYLKQVVVDLDYEFGGGYAKKNPELVGRLVESCIRDYHTAAFLTASQNIVEALRAISLNIRTDHPLQGETLDGVSHALGNIASAIAR